MVKGVSSQASIPGQEGLHKSTVPLTHLANKKKKKLF